jgi:hypothetical protein
MGGVIKPTQTDIDIAKMGIDIQFTSMFDEPTRKSMEAQGIQKFIDHMIELRASDGATIRFYSNLVHLTPKDS